MNTAKSNLLVHSPFAGHVSCIQSLASYESKQQLRIFLDKPFYEHRPLFISGKYPGVHLLGQRVKVCLTFYIETALPNHFQSDYAALCTHQQYAEFQLLLVSGIIWWCQSF